MSITMRRRSSNSPRGSFSYRNSPSNPPHPPPPPQPKLNNVPKRTHSFQFPTSPQSTLGEEVFHSNHHPHHPLAKLTLPEIFTCSGCKEFGAGKRFTCQTCDFQLHEFCALSPSSLKNHPLHGQHNLIFLPKPVKTGMLGSKCDICGKSVKGFSFRCSACNFHMHPCCAMLSPDIKFSTHPHPLKLYPGGSSGGGDTTTLPCSECRKKRPGRVYRCTTCHYLLHAVCAKNMINGLQAYGYKSPEKPSMIGAAARVASIVIVEFIGGLIEGIGEGVGGALVQNIARGRCVSRRRSRRIVE